VVLETIDIFTGIKSWLALYDILVSLNIFYITNSSSRVGRNVNHQTVDPLTGKYFKTRIFHKHDSFMKRRECFN
jgi:hypothetical protein